MAGEPMGKVELQKNFIEALSFPIGFLLVLFYCSFSEFSQYG